MIPKIPHSEVIYLVKLRTEQYPADSYHGVTLRKVFYDVSRQIYAHIHIQLKQHRYDFNLSVDIKLWVLQSASVVSG